MENAGFSHDRYINNITPQIPLQYTMIEKTFRDAS